MKAQSSNPPRPRQRRQSQHAQRAKIKRHFRPEKVKQYEARWYVEGRLKCRFFATEQEREQFIEEFESTLARAGSDLLLGFDPAKMRRWQEASKLAPDADPVEVMYTAPA